MTSDAGPYRVPRLERSENTEREDTMHLYLYGRRWQSSRCRLEMPVVHLVAEPAAAGSTSALGE